MRIPRAAVVLTVAALVAAAPLSPGVSAHTGGEKHEADATHLKGVENHEAQRFASGPPSQLVANNFEVLGHVNVGGGSPTGDVFFYDYGEPVGKYAFVGTWSSPCSGAGARIIDVNDPRHPQVVARAGGRTGVSNEDVVVAEIGGTEVMGLGVQLCKPQGGSGGLALFDVSNPGRPKPLSFVPVPAGGVHELDMVVRPDGTALALLAVPFVEFENTYFDAAAGGEFRIVDITDPSNPSEIGEGWGVIADSALKNWGGGGQEIDSSFQGLGYFAAHYAHSVRAADDGMTAYVSYWDSGVLKFDISDPANPALLARTQYGPEDDGDAHSMTPYEPGATRYILQNDEDFASLSPVIVTSSATGPTQYSGIDEPWAPTLLSEGGTAISGTVWDAGDGCQASDYSGTEGKIALADTVDPFYEGIIPNWTVPCAIGDQVIMAAEAGATAIVFNLISPDDAWPFFVGDFRAVQEAAQGIPIVQISDIDGLAAAIRGSASPDITLDPGDPTWGYVRVFTESGAADVNGDGVPEYTEVGEFPGSDDVASLPHTRGELFTPPGSWSVHNTEVKGNRAYSAWYSHGIVAINMTNPTDPDFVGQFVPPTSKRFAGSLGTGPAEVWGVAIDPDTGYVYASEMRTGLWIVKPTGAAAA